MTSKERRINNYSLRNALMLVAYGVFGILLFPRLLSYIEDIPSTMFWVVRFAVLVLYLSYIFIGFTTMMTPRKLRENHLIINLLFLVVFVNCVFLGFYLASKDGFQNPTLTALTLSSLLISGVIVYYFTKFQITSKESKALLNMSTMLLIFSGGGEIFFHHVPYLNTILGWFVIWIALSIPGRKLWKSFIYSILASSLFYIPRMDIAVSGETKLTLLDILRRFIVENEIPPMYFIYIYFGLIMVLVFVILNIKLKMENGEAKTPKLSSESPQLVDNK